MKRISQTRPPGSGGLLPFCGALCLSLGFMVFAWGTNYKLSLYKADCQSSPAKVCTRGSDAAKHALDHAVDDSAVAHAPLSMAALFSLLQGIKDCPINRLRDDVVIDLSPLSRAPILYLRPPPDEGRSYD